MLTLYSKFKHIKSNQYRKNIPRAKKISIGRTTFPRSYCYKKVVYLSA